MRLTQLCDSLRGVGRDERRNTRDKDLDNFRPRETSSGSNPTCCLWLGLIMLMRESPVSWLFVSSPRDCFLLLVPLWGALSLLIYVEGAGYMWSPIRIRTSLSLIQTGYKSVSLTPCKVIFFTPFLLNRPTININRPSGPWALSSVCLAHRVTSES